MTKKTKKDENLNIPVDLYVRHSLAKSIIEDVFRGSSKNKLKILDVGGYKGKTQDFLPKDRVEVLDVYDVSEPHYTKGDATAMTFKDGEFDVVTSFDVLEHIPRAKRKAFISEKVRVSKHGVVMTLPIDTAKGGPTTVAEKQLNDFFVKISGGQEHPWLKEHIEYGIPTVKEVEALLQGSNMSFKILFSNNLEAWKIIQAINFSATVCEEGVEAASSVNTAYNGNTQKLEPVTENGYRAIVIIAKTSVISKKLDEYYKSISVIDNAASALDITINAALSFMSVMVKSMTDARKDMRDLTNKLDRSNQRVVNLESELSSIKQSKAWRTVTAARSIKSHIKRDK